jgi:hypothetical protein
MNQTAICLGAHVFDVQLRPVETIPDGQGVGSDHGDFSLAEADAFAENTPTLWRIRLTPAAARLPGPAPACGCGHRDRPQ